MFTQTISFYAIYPHYERKIVSVKNHATKVYGLIQWCIPTWYPIINEKVIAMIYRLLKSVK